MYGFLNGSLIATDSKNREQMMKCFSENARIRYTIGAPLWLMSENGAEMKTSPVEKVIASRDGIVKLWTRSGTYYCIALD